MIDGQELSSNKEEKEKLLAEYSELVHTVSSELDQRIKANGMRGRVSVTRDSTSVDISVAGVFEGYGRGNIYFSHLTDSNHPWVLSRFLPFPVTESLSLDLHTDKATQEALINVIGKDPYEFMGEVYKPYTGYFLHEGKGYKVFPLPETLHDPRPTIYEHDGVEYKMIPMEESDYKLGKLALMRFNQELQTLTVL